MTTRFSLSELADMLGSPVEWVRLAVDTLSAAGELTAESFIFGGRNWRIAPSDVKRIQTWLEEGVQSGFLTAEPKQNRSVRRRIVKP